MNKITQITNAMIAYYAGDARRIHHFLTVYGFAKTIGELESLAESTQNILEIAALTHDIGIKNSEQKYNSSAGQYQQTEGPPEAKKMLAALAVAPAVIDRVCWLIAHHHTYTDVQGSDYQILVEADFIVNAYEEHSAPDSILRVRNQIFRTKSGTELLNLTFPLDAF